ncbi:MAG: aquaporin [Lewinellaceae bacterium]|nr:aquaporin [Lewinellaceae bacterium]
MKQYLMEGIGTFLLVFLVVLISNNAPAGQAPLAYGAAVAGLLYAGRHISGAHFNPAISLAMLIRGGLERWDFPYYLVAQVVGSVFGAVLAVFLIRCGGTAEVVLQQHDTVCSFFAETAGAFALIFVFLNTGRVTENNAHQGIAVGFTVLAAVYALGNIAPATFNPALALGMAIVGKMAWGDIWAGLLGTTVGAAAAASAYRLLHDHEE